MRKIFFLCVMSIVLFAGDMTPNLNHEGYKKSLNPFSLEQCTAFVWGRAYEKKDIKIKFRKTSGRHAKYWYKLVSGLKKGSEIKNNSIVVWGGDSYNTYGHVAFIEKVENNYVYFNEANFKTFYTGGGYDGSVKKWSLTKFKKYRKAAGNIVGYIYLNSEVEPLPINNKLSIVDGAGSLIRAEILGTEEEGDCTWGCYRDEADMQKHSTPSTVSFQWKATNNCQKLKIGVMTSEDYRTAHPGVWIHPYKALKVKMYTKAWDSSVVSEAFETTLPKTVDYVAGWNNIIVTSQKPLTEVQKIIAECTENDDGKDMSMLDKTLIDLPLEYKFGGQSSIIRGSNANYNEQQDGIYQDVAIGLSNNKSMSLFQWQTSRNCKSLVIKSGHYPNENGLNTALNGVSIKGWSDKDWVDHKCNKKLPCTINAPSSNGGKYENYYIIKVKTNANALDGNRVSAVCKQ